MDSVTPDPPLRQLVDLASRSPSGHNAQPWTIVKTRRLWSDGIRAAVEDKLGDVLANIETRAKENEQRRLELERRDEERRHARSLCLDPSATWPTDVGHAWPPSRTVAGMVARREGSLGHPLLHHRALQQVLPHERIGRNDALRLLE